MFFKKRKTKRRKRTPSKHYLEHKELARALVHERLEYWNQLYQFEYNRVSIKNQKTCWGSCSEHGNLNFNYKVIFLPHALMDYIIVHELCHRAELNHSPAFWSHVERAIPEYREHRSHLKRMTHIPQKGFPSSIFALQEIK
ncbi:M48 family metallopeptidase [bacterium]|nr:M48 family metallopeptidase [bacterium]